MAIDIEDPELDERERQNEPTEDTEAPAYQPAMATGGGDEMSRTGEPSASGALPQGLPPDRANVRNAAMGGAMVPSPAAPSPAAKDLGEFAAATGTAKPAATQTPLQAVRPAPQPPMANPELGTTEADLRAHATPTPKYDPQTGKTLDKYHPGVGSRIGRAFLDLARGGIPGVAEGAMGDRSQPGYFGPGAVNSQYFRDEWARQQAEGADKAKIDSLQREDTTAQRDFRNKESAYKDDVRRGYEETTTQERNRHQQEEEKLKQDAQDLKEQMRSITYDPNTKQFMRGGNIYTPSKVEEGAILEIQNGIKNGPYKQMWDKERRNSPVQIHTGEKALSARDQLKIRSYLKANKIKSQDDLTPEQIDEALATKPGQDPADVKLSHDELANYKNDTKGQDEELAGLYKDRSLYQASLTDPKLGETSKAALAGVNQRITELQGQKDAIRQKYVQGRKPPAGQSGKATPSPTPTPNNQPAKSISKAKVQELANKNKIPYADAEKQFKAKNYTIQ